MWRWWWAARSACSHCGRNFSGGNGVGYVMRCKCRRVVVVRVVVEVMIAVYQGVYRSVLVDGDDGKRKLDSWRW